MLHQISDEEQINEVFPETHFLSGLQHSSVISLWVLIQIILYNSNHYSIPGKKVETHGISWFRRPSLTHLL